MTTNKQDGGPAFPPFHDPKNHDSGMTLRDYFAGQALAGSRLSIFKWEQKANAEFAYEQADAMIAERNKQ